MYLPAGWLKLRSAAQRLLAVGALLVLHHPVPAAPPQPDDPRYAGYRIYELGLLPDGTPLRASRPEGFTGEGASAACVTCHRRSGMGSVEGQLERTVLVPPVAGAVLFAPSRYVDTYLDPTHHYQPNEAWTRVLTRPAYDDASLARALRDGSDPGGQPLQAPMPRYALGDAEIRSLAEYLRGLSAAADPGVTDDTLHLASVVTPDVPPGLADTVLGVIRAWSESAHGAGRAWRLHVWKLSGPPAQWGAQLAAFYREQPVFALLSGAGAAEWTPVQRFCASRRIPCVLPSVERVVENSDDDYSLFYSTGVELEARVLARHLDDMATDEAPKAEIIQIVSDASGQAAAATLQRHYAAGAGRVSMRQFRPDDPASALAGLDGRQILVLWLRSSEIAALAAAVPQGAAARVYLSDLLAPSGVLDVPSEWKRNIFYVSLFDDLGYQGEIARLRLRRWLEQAGLPGTGDLRVQADVYTACYLFNKATAEIRAQEVRRPAVPLSREQVLEMLEVLTSKYSDGTTLVDPDSHVAYYGRMSLGPGQRVAVRGGVILRFPDAGAKRLVKVGTRIVP